MDKNLHSLGQKRCTTDPVRLIVNFVCRLYFDDLDLCLLKEL
jgi:hypothetical protein